MKMTDQINIGNLPYVEALYRKYLAEPTSIADEWRRYFAQIGGNGPDGADHTRLGGSLQPLSSTSHEKDGNAAAAQPSGFILPTQLNEIIQAYRAYGHLNARIDPLGHLNLRKQVEVNLEPEAFGFTESHMDKLFASES